MKTINRVIDAVSLCQKVRKRLFEHSRTKSHINQRRAAFYDELWRDAAAAVGASTRDLGVSSLEIIHGDVNVRVCENMTSLDDPVTLKIAGDKPEVYRLLVDHGIPCPRYSVCSHDDLTAAWAFVRAARGPCVVKPAAGGAAGAGVTTGIQSRFRLALAMALAGAYCGELVVEEQVPGDNYRLLFFDGALLDAVLRHPPVIRGDGRLSLEQLIVAENADRSRAGIAAAQSLIAIDEDLRNTVRSQGKSLRSVLAAGEVVTVKSVVNDNRGTDNVGAVTDICRAVVEAAAAAAAAVGARLAGVDVITSDPSRPLAETGGVVLEVNTTPGYYYHYMQADGAVPVAALLLEQLMGA